MKFQQLKKKRKKNTKIVMSISHQILVTQSYFSITLIQQI